MEKVRIEQTCLKNTIQCSVMSKRACEHGETKTNSDQLQLLTAQDQKGPEKKSKGESALLHVAACEHHMKSPPGGGFLHQIATVKPPKSTGVDLITQKCSCSSTFRNAPVKISYF